MKKIILIFITILAIVGTSYAKKDNPAVYAKLVKTEKYIDNFSNSNKDIGEIAYEIGNIYFSINRYDKAIKMFQKAIKSGYNDSDAYYLLSICYKETKDYSKSIYFLNKAVQIVEAEKKIVAQQ